MAINVGISTDNINAKEMLTQILELLAADKLVVQRVVVESDQADGYAKVIHVEISGIIYTSG